MAKKLKREGKTDKVRHHGESTYGHNDRGPNTGQWEKIYGNWAPGARLKFDPDWHRGYNGSGKGTW